MSKITHSAITIRSALQSLMYQTIRFYILVRNRQHERILDAEEKGEQMNKSVANTVYLETDLINIRKKVLT